MGLAWGLHSSEMETSMGALSSPKDKRFLMTEDTDGTAISPSSSLPLEVRRMQNCIVGR